jgi:hypothetical protein
MKGHDIAPPLPAAMKLPVLLAKRFRQICRFCFDYVQSISARLICNIMRSPEILERFQ